MNPFAHAAPLVERLGWSLVHSVWQFAAAAAFAACLLVALRRRSAAARHAALVGVLALALAAPVVTFCSTPLAVPPPPALAAVSGGVEEADAAPAAFPFGQPTLERSRRDRRSSALGATLDEYAAADASTSNDSAAAPPVGARGARSDWRERARGALRPWLAPLVGVWACGALLAALRPLVGWRALRRLKSVGLRAPTEVVAAAARRAAERIGVTRSFEVFESTLARTPLVAGWLRPLILVPAALAANLPVAQLEALLAHELAHVRRHDFALNLLQTLVETLFFYHPAAWWLSRRLRIEREHCCDDWVVQRLGRRAEYGRALLAVEELQAAESVLAVAARDGSLLARVRRIVGGEASAPGRGDGAAALGLASLVLAGAALFAQAAQESRTPAAIGDAAVASRVAGETATTSEEEPPSRPGASDWPMWGGDARRNHVSHGRPPRDWDGATGRNVAWRTRIGTSAYASPVVSGGRVFLGTDNGAGLDPRRPQDQDFACLICLDERTGRLEWQYASAKRPEGRRYDWPNIGLCSTPCVVGDRVWVLTNRCEVACLDVRGFHDGEDDGTAQPADERTPLDADVVWIYDLFDRQGVRPLHQAVSSLAVVDGLVLLNTANGPDEERRAVPAPQAPHFVALDAATGELVWRDNSSGDAILAGGSSCGCSGASPAVATIGGVRQAIFPGREGWLFAFDFADLRRGQTTRLWSFDCNPKTSRYESLDRGRRNSLVASPVVVGDRVFVATGRDPENGEGDGDLWCIDGTKRGDLSAELVFNPTHRDGREPIPHKPFQACVPEQGDFTRPNPGSGVVWHYDGRDVDGDGRREFHETLHRSLGNPTIHDGLLYLADYSGLVHCVDARTGEGVWTHDVMAFVWNSCVVVDGRVLVADNDGDVAILRAARKLEVLAEGDDRNVGGPIFAAPAATGDTLFVVTQTECVAFRETARKPTFDATLVGRFVYDGVPPPPADVHPLLTKLDVDDPRPDEKLANAKGIVKSYLELARRGLRPETLDRSLVVGPDRGIANVVVWASSPDMPRAELREPLAPAALAVQAGQFGRRVTLLGVGQKLRVENEDPLGFHVRASFVRNRPFDVLLGPCEDPRNPAAAFEWTPQGAETSPSPLRSDFAVWAEGWVLVRPDAYMAVTDERGRFTIAGLPPGEWEFRAWHERRGFLETWPRGKFRKQIRSGENSLGDVQVAPELVHCPER